MRSAVTDCYPVGLVTLKAICLKNALWTVVLIIAIMGGLVPLTQLVNLVNIGTLIAFAFVSIGIILCADIKPLTMKVSRFLGIQ